MYGPGNDPALTWLILAKDSCGLGNRGPEIGAVQAVIAQAEYLERIAAAIERIADVFEEEQANAEPHRSARIFGAS